MEKTCSQGRAKPKAHGKRRFKGRRMKESQQEHPTGRMDRWTQHTSPTEEPSHVSTKHLEHTNTEHPDYTKPPHWYHHQCPYGNMKHGLKEAAMAMH